MWTALLSRWRGVPVGTAVWTGIAIAVGGALLLTGADVQVSGRALVGDGLALAGGLFAAAYVVAGGEVRRSVSTTTYTFVCYSVAALLLLVVCVAGRQALGGYEGVDWLKLVGITAGAQLLGHSLFNVVLRSTSPTVVSLAVLLEIPGAALLAAAFLGQTPPLLALPGGAAAARRAGVVVRAGSRAAEPARAGRVTPERLRAALVRVGEAVRDDVLAACRAQTVEQLSAYDDSGPGRHRLRRRPRLRGAAARARRRLCPVRLVAEGVVVRRTATPSGRCSPTRSTAPGRWRTRSAAPGCSSAPRAASASPTSRCRSPSRCRPSRPAGPTSSPPCAAQGVVAERVDLRDGSRAPLSVRPSRATGLEQGYGGVARYFPGARAELADIDDAVHRRVLGPARPGKAQSFEDQWCTGGTLRRARRRPRPVGLPTCARCSATGPGICAHPYDLAGLARRRRGGRARRAPDGAPLDAPLDLTTDVAWAAYANDAVRALVEPALHAELAERGLCRDDARRSRSVRAAGRVRGSARAARAGLRRGDRLRRPGQLRHQRRGGRGPRVPAGCGSSSLANLMAMLVQSLSGKVGLATGRNLPELCRDHFPRPVVPRAVGAGRARRDGHRPGRGHRRRHRAEPAVRRSRC